MANTVSPTVVAPADRVRSLVIGILAERAPERPFSDNDVLSEVGISSMDMVTLLLSIENEFDIEIPHHELTPDVFKSVATIDGMLRRLRPVAA